MKTARFVVFQDKRKQWRWHLQAKNGRIICQGESHKSWRHAMRAIQTVRDTIRGLTYIDMVKSDGL